MSEFEEGLPPTWFRDISNAFALSTQSTPERRLQAFLATLSSEETENHAGVLLTRAGQLDAAIESFRRALALEPGFRNAEVNLHQALRLKLESNSATK